MQGLMHTASISARSGGTWVDSGTTWKCRLQPLSPTVKIQNEVLANTTHITIGNPTPVIAVGNQLTISDVIYNVIGSQMHDRPGVGHHHQELWLVKAE